MPEPEQLPLTTERVYCNGCARETNHQQLCIHRTADTSLYEEEFEVGWYHRYTLLKCLGCDTICLRQESLFSESHPTDPPRTTFFPPPLARRSPDWLDELSPEQSSLLREVYTALQA